MTKNNKADLTGQAFKLEEKLLSEGYDFVIGIDEAGRGPLAGPVAACACAHKRNLKFVNSNSDKKNPNYKLQITNYDKIKDSKALSPNQREELYNFILDNFYVGVGICDHKTIDRINILEATYLAAKKSLSDLFNKINQDTIIKKIPNYKIQITNKFQIPKFKIKRL